MASATRTLSTQTLELSKHIYKGILTYTAEIPEKNTGSDAAEKVVKLLDAAAYLGKGFLTKQLEPSTLKEKIVAIQSVSSPSTNLSSLIKAIDQLIFNVQTDLGLFIKKNLPASQRIQEHNDKADAWLEEEDPGHGLADYPVTPEQKQQCRLGRNHVKEIKHFVGPAQFISETSELATCTVSCAAARGYRDYMEDRNLARVITFEAGGVHYLADLVGVFDGHSGIEVVDYVIAQLPVKLKELLNARLKNRPLNDDDLFFCFKDAIKQLHQEVLDKNMKSGTTAVFAFRVIGEERIWTVNVGDSRAFIQRGGRAIAMSVDQKPSYKGEERADLISFQHPNEYALQLIKKGVLFCDKSKYDAVLPEVKRGDKMVFSYIGSSHQIHRMLLGIPNKKHLDMARSIGDHEFEKWKKHTPENFSRKLQVGDQLVLHSDGIDASPHRVSELIHRDRFEGVTARETTECLAQASLPAKKDNVTAMIVTFHNPHTSFKSQFFAAYTRESSERLKIRFQQLRLQDPDFFTLLCKNAYFIQHDAWERNGREGAEPGVGNFKYGEEQILALLDQPIQNCERFLEVFTYKS